jgi:FkbM family methyltransferase
MKNNPRRVLRKIGWRLIHLGPRRDVRIDTENGVLFCDSKDWLIGKYLYVDRSYEAESISTTLEFLRNEGYLKPGRARTVLDVGANIGMICIALLKDGHFERAVAFEPSPTNFRLLKKNVATNGLGDRVTCFPYALSFENGETDLEISRHNSGDNSIRASGEGLAFGEDERPSVKTEVRSLDSLVLSDPGIDASDTDLVWVDIQGYEGFFFIGASEFLRRGMPVVSEFWPYGINRAGMSREEFCRVVAARFGKFAHLRNGRFELLPINAIASLFEIYRAPREFGHLIFLP